jgi:hypothetical protein
MDGRGIGSRRISGISGHDELPKAAGIAVAALIAVAFVWFIALLPLGVLTDDLHVSTVAGIDLLRLTDALTGPMLATWLLVCIVCAVLAIHEWWQRGRTEALLRKVGMPSSAHVAEVAVTEPDGDRTWRVTYWYIVQGRWHRNSRLFGRTTLQVGDRFNIVYDPEHPEVHGWLDD